MKGCSSAMPRYVVRISMADSYACVVAVLTNPSPAASASASSCVACGPLGRFRKSIENIGEASVQPRVAADVVVVRVHRFAEHVRAIAAKPGDFLREPPLRRVHELGVAAVPQVVTMGERAGNTSAHGFNDMFAQQFGGDRRQFAVPENFLGRV